MLIFRYASSQKKSKKHGITSNMSFDQELWWLAMFIIENASLECPMTGIINKNGGFHTIMDLGVI
jgi:hypothetical protein